MKQTTTLTFFSSSFFRFVHYLKYDIYRERRILLILLYYIIEINFLYNLFLHLQYIRLDICFYFIFLWSAK